MRPKMFGLVVFLGCWTAVSHARASGPSTTHLWSQHFGDAGFQQSYAVAVDGSGNVIVAGQFTGTVNFGGSDLVSAGSNDIFLAKFNSVGVHQWSKRFGDGSDQYCYSVATDVLGDIIIAGYFTGTVDFGTVPEVSSGGFDSYVAKFGSGGNAHWSHGSGSAGDQSGYSVATDFLRNIVITGYFTGTVNFGGANLTSAGSNDIFVASYEAVNSLRWSNRFGDANNQQAYSVAVDASGNVIVGGHFAGTVNFGGANLTSLGSTDVFIAKFNNAGAHQWSQRFGDASAQTCQSVAVDASGNVLATGYFAGTVNFGGGNLTSTGSSDTFVAKFNAAGTHQWSRGFGSAGDQNGYSIVADPVGNVIVSGFFNGTINFGGPDLTSAGSTDVFIAKFSSTGFHRLSQRFGDATNDYGLSVATDPSGNMIATGFFNGTINFGGANHTTAGGSDAFVVKFGPDPVEPRVESITDVGNDQGRQVRIEFFRSGSDSPSSPTEIVEYEVYRRTDPLPALEERGVPFDGAAPNPEPLVSGWAFVGAVPSHGETTYEAFAPTLADSTIADGQHYSAFYIRATTPNKFVFFDSTADSGYSLDNLAPGIPASFAYSVAQLTWDESKAADFDYFSVYGSNTNSFASATLIDYTVTPVMNVSASPYTYYFATATDFSGNEGKPAVVNSLTGVGGTPKSYVLSISSYPNPFNPETTIRYTVPSKGRVSVEVYDARGAQVTALVDMTKEAGAYTEVWDGRDAGGKPVSSGVYFARVAHPSGTRSYKIVLLK